jgi:hypothetical protein
MLRGEDSKKVGKKARGVWRCKDALMVEHVMDKRRKKKVKKTLQNK